MPSPLGGTMLMRGRCAERWSSCCNDSMVEKLTAEEASPPEPLRKQGATLDPRFDRTGRDSRFFARLDTREAKPYSRGPPSGCFRHGLWSALAVSPLVVCRRRGRRRERRDQRERGIADQYPNKLGRPVFV